MMLTAKERKALNILNNSTRRLGMRAMEFAVLYFDDDKYQYLFESVSQQGNGACSGKKAWRAAGCVLGKLTKKGYVKNVWQHYLITEVGKKKLNEE